MEAGKNKQIVLTMDQAGWHTSSQVKIPEGIHLVLMPSHSQELQPAERLWPLTNQPIANQLFATRRCFGRSAISAMSSIAEATRLNSWSNQLLLVAPSGNVNYGQLTGLDIIGREGKSAIFIWR